MKLARVRGRVLRLPKALRREKVVTVELLEKAKVRLHAGDERAAACKRAKDVDDLTTEIERALYFVLHPFPVRRGRLLLSRLVAWHIHEGEKPIWQVKYKRWSPRAEKDVVRWELWGDAARRERLAEMIGELDDRI